MVPLTIKLPRKLMWAVKRAADLPPKQTPSSYVRALLVHTLDRRPAKEPAR